VYWLIFLAAVRADMVWLALVGVITSVISAGYYLKVLWYIWMKSPEEAPEPAKGFRITIPLGVASVLLLCALALLGLGVFSPDVFALTDHFFSSATMAMVP